MEDLTVWVVLFAGFLKTDPVYSFVLDAFPLMIVSTFGAISAQFCSSNEITKRSTVAGIMSAMSLAIIINAVAREYQLKIHVQVCVALVAGLKGEQVLKVITDKIVEKVKNYNGK